MAKTERTTTIVLDCDGDGGNDRSRRQLRQGKDGGTIMKIEPKVYESVLCVLLQDLMTFEYMSMRNRGKIGAGIPVFVGQHEPESAEASRNVEHS